MRGKKTTELEYLASGLGSVEDPYRIKELLKRSPDDLAEEIQKQIRYTAAAMITQGRFFMAIKEQLRHGEWEPFVQKQKWSFNYVRCCMKLLEVAAKFPQAMHLTPGRMTQQLLQLPMPAIDSLLNGAPPEAIKKLTPWDIEDIYNKKKLEDSRAKPKKKAVVPPANGLDDQEWMAFLKLHAAALTAVAALADAEIKSEWYDRIFDLELLKKLGKLYNEVILKLHPREEVEKRRIVKHAPGFTR